MSSSSASNLHGGDEVVGHQVGQPPPLPPLASGSTGSTHHQHHLHHHSQSSHHQPQKPQQQQPVDSHYKNLPLGKPSSSSSSSLQQHQGNNSSITNHPHGSTVYAQRADVWSPVTSSVTTPPPPTPDDELLGQLSLDELISRIRSLETKNRKLLYDNGSMTKDINHHLSSLQQLKQQNYHLISENNELRELACFLEDERSRCRSIAREWQSFGTHMSRVMRHEVTNYSNKLTQLEGKQFELVRENFELKQLCLLLDNALTTREGSESSLLSSMDPPSHNNPTVNSNGLTNSNSSFALRAKAIKGANNITLSTNENVQPQHRMILSQQILEYIRSLEDRIKQLETEKVKSIENSRPINNHCESTYENTSVLNNNSNPTLDGDHNRNHQQSGLLPSCPQPLLVAMQALKIQEDLGTTDNSKISATSTTNTTTTTTTTTNTNNINSTTIDNIRTNPSTINENSNEIITDQHKAIVKGLCNVIWRKIEDSS